ncbi:hypothetical protein PGH26_05045 [Sporosarcina jeotgali]|uniref:RNA polymerase subunit sigma n=1 Tax=Sporosarcina jeotgali TaxID=3020056 RepID=A0ABZ0L082_9BACL|nr:hypothetical protein [Sporosarcina sp. B2O-1]WOV85303.1 hypothetical protein PGH26_05045 [Sporosarcina sp. B2O-1]
MSLKSIELQIAIPKTFDAGKLTEQKNQQSMLNHQTAAAQTDQQVMKQRNTVIESAESEKTKNAGNFSEEESAGDNEQKDESSSQKELKHASHPYKGGFVDYTG